MRCGNQAKTSEKNYQEKHLMMPNFTATKKKPPVSWRPFNKCRPAFQKGFRMAMH